MWRRWEKAREGLTEHKKAGIGLPSGEGFLLEVRITRKNIFCKPEDKKIRKEHLLRSSFRDEFSAAKGGGGVTSPGPGGSKSQGGKGENTSQPHSLGILA